MQMTGFKLGLTEIKNLCSSKESARQYFLQGLLNEKSHSKIGLVVTFFRHRYQVILNPTIECPIIYNHIAFNQNDVARPREDACPSLLKKL